MSRITRTPPPVKTIFSFHISPWYPTTRPGYTVGQHHTLFYFSAKLFIARCMTTHHHQRNRPFPRQRNSEHPAKCGKKKSERQARPQPRRRIRAGFSLDHKMSPEKGTDIQYKMHTPLPSASSCGIGQQQKELPRQQKRMPSTFANKTTLQYTHLFLHRPAHRTTESPPLL